VADHRSFGSRPHPLLLREAPEHFPDRRVPAPPSKLRGRLLVAALTAGACVAAALSGDQADPGSPEPPAAHRTDGPAAAPLAAVAPLPAP